MTPFVNVQSIMLISGVVYVLLAITVWTILHRRYYAAPVWLWSIGSIAGGLGIILLAVRGSVPDWVTYQAANGLMYASLVLRIMALRLDLGRPLRPAAGAGLWALPMLIYGASLLWPAPGPRAITTTALLAIGTGALAACAFAVGRFVASRSAFVLAWIEAALVLALAVRLLFQMAGSSPTQGVSQSWDFLALVAVSVAAGLYGNLGYLGMVLDRSRATEAQAQSARLQEAAGRQAAERVASELRALLAERDRLASDRSHLLQVLAHEIRQPVHNASGALQAAASALQAPQPEGAPDVAGPLHRAQEMLGGMQAVLDNALAGAALLARDEPLMRQDVDLGFMVQLALGDLTPTQRAQVQVVWHTALVSAALEPNLVRLALRNLLRNAFMHGGAGVTVQLRVADSPSPPALLLAVADTGVGLTIPAWQQLAHMPPDAGLPATRRGLGLYIARRVMALHGGDLVLQANPPHGLVATLHFPRA